MRWRSVCGRTMPPPSSVVFDATAPSFTYTPTTGGTYDLAVSAGGTGVWQDKTGDFQISLVDQGIVITTRFAKAPTRRRRWASGRTVNGTIDQNGIDGADLTIDKDWYAVTLIAGHTYTFSARLAWQRRRHPLPGGGPSVAERCHLRLRGVRRHRPELPTRRRRAARTIWR